MKLKKVKQICALIGVILLVALYLSTLIFALMEHENSMAFLKASIYATVIIPVLIWAMGMIARLLKKHYSDSVENILSENRQTDPSVNAEDPSVNTNDSSTNTNDSAAITNDSFTNTNDSAAITNDSAANKS